MTSPKSILFLGATGGCCLSSLRRSLEAGDICVALVRSPKKLAALLPFPSYPNLTVIEGNAHDEAAVSQALLVPGRGSTVIDLVITSIGSQPSMGGLTGIQDPTVCEKGMTVLLSALRALHARGSTSLPRVVAVSSTGLSRLGRDVPLPILPLYRLLLAGAHKDKRAMEDALIGFRDAPVEWTIVRPSMYVDGSGAAGEKKTVRVGVEDPVKGTVESKAVGYTISREDVGRWMFEALVQDEGEARRLVGKVATITH